MPPAKTGAARVQELRARRLKLGLTRLELYAHPDDHPPIKTYAAKKTARREKERKQ